MTQCKDEVVAHPHMMDLGYHLVVPAIPNRRKPIKEHRWLARKALLCRVPWGLSAGIAGPLTLPADLGYVGQGRNRFCYLVPATNEHAQPSVLKLVAGDERWHGEGGIPAAPFALCSGVLGRGGQDQIAEQLGPGSFGAPGPGPSEVRIGRFLAPHPAGQP